MVDKFLAEFSRGESGMMQQEGEESPAAYAFAESYGFKLLGVRGLDIGTTSYTAMFVERPAASADAAKDAVKYVVEDFGKRKYPTSIAAILDQHGNRVYVHLIMEKVYEGGGTAILESPGSLEGKPITAVGIHDGNTLMGYFSHTNPTYVDDVRAIAEFLGMLPQPKQDKSSADNAVDRYLKELGF